METLEIEGKTIDKAIEKACYEFDVPREKLNIEIISEGTSGFLGLGSKRAKVRASIMSLDATLNASLEQPQKMIQKGFGSGSGESIKTEEPCESVGIRAKRFLEGILFRMNLSCPVNVEETSETVVLNIKGDGGGLLIGKRGQNLDAIQYIVNRAVNKTANVLKKIIVDTEEYRKRREDALIAMAERFGEKVKKTKKAVTVGHMNARDRRIIHLTLQNDELLTTKSRGEGEYRKIIIMPAKKE
ncbi:MAG: RNA-binding cell elongation regulator Jag/EloR [Syntrophales bacterium]|nr:RNA-binding cell elongation regulator Jag/EloR [Syntrophales bacterium]